MILEVDGDHNSWFCGGGSKIEVVEVEKLDLFFEKRRSQWLPSARGLGRIQGGCLSTSKRPWLTESTNNKRYKSSAAAMLWGQE